MQNLMQGGSSLSQLWPRSQRAAFPQPAPGTAPSPGPLKVPEDKLRSVLGIATVAVKQGTQPLAIIDSDLTKV
jgi:hypothetical protein